jgi:hypothetical protein
VSTTKQKEAARKNLEKARRARSERAKGKKVERSAAMTEAERDRLSESQFAFAEQRKEPIHDAEHVRNAIARFDQVEDVSDDDRDKAWRRIKAAAKRFDVEVEADNWRELFKGGKNRRH